MWRRKDGGSSWSGGKGVGRDRVKIIWDGVGIVGQEGEGGEMLFSWTVPLHHATTLPYPTNLSAILLYTSLPNILPNQPSPANQPIPYSLSPCPVSLLVVPRRVLADLSSALVVGSSLNHSLTHPFSCQLFPGLLDRPLTRPRETLPLLRPLLYMSPHCTSLFHILLSPLTAPLCSTSSSLPSLHLSVSHHPLSPHCTSLFPIILSPYFTSCVPSFPPSPHILPLSILSPHLTHILRPFIPSPTSPHACLPHSQQISLPLFRTSPPPLPSS
ncbi:hypothetical protein Pcinc_036141, partial [Petrolisthes cinctipes]